MSKLKGTKKSKTTLIIEGETEIKYDDTLVTTINKKIKLPKPILKWIGGKTQILDKLIIEFPSKINNYHEIFLGGGSVLLGIL